MFLLYGSSIPQMFITIYTDATMHWTVALKSICKKFSRVMDGNGQIRILFCLTSFSTNGVFMYTFSLLKLHTIKHLLLWCECCHELSCWWRLAHQQQGMLHLAGLSTPRDWVQYCELSSAFKVNWRKHFKMLISSKISTTGYLHL